jgi:hypothetical protein
MQELVEQLGRFQASTDAPHPADTGTPQGALRAAGARWASFCIYTLTGETLYEGLRIAEDIARFCGTLDAEGGE